ncbi:hypothetical protein S245_051905 [Arachis hypogaea]|nr:uncharacterized protein DS421_15g501070 [Arachis hypogaea]
MTEISLLLANGKVHQNMYIKSVWITGVRLSLIWKSSSRRRKDGEEEQDNDICARHFIRNSMFDILFLYQRCMFNILFLYSMKFLYFEKSFLFVLNYVGSVP